MKAISVRSPWWRFILHGGKPIENRSWSTKLRGTVGLHASSWYKMDEVYDDMEFGVSAMVATGHLPPDGVDRVTHRMLMPSRGCLIGTVDIVDCIDRSDSPWFCGPYGFVLANPVAFKKPIPCKGALGFFEVPGDIAQQVVA